MHLARLLVLMVALHCLGLVGGASAAEPVRPNVVVIYVDDMGYGDVGCYGSDIPTPNLDRLAASGVRFTDFYAAQAVCSASRAALLTGCYPNRVGIQGAHFQFRQRPLAAVRRSCRVGAAVAGR